REQCALHDLREIDEREHGAIEIGEVRPEDGRLVVAEVLRGVHTHSLASRAPASGRAGDGIGVALPRWGFDQTTRRNAPGTTAMVTRAAAGAGTPSISSGSDPRSARISTRRPVVWVMSGCGRCTPCGSRRRTPERWLRASAYTWISARPSPGWPRGTTSLPRRYCPLATTTAVAGPSCATRSSTRTRTPGDRVTQRARSGATPT